MSCLQTSRLRYSVGEISKTCRKSLARHSPLVSPQRRAILSTGKSLDISMAAANSTRDRRRCSDGFTPISARKCRKYERSLIPAVCAATVIEIGLLQLRVIHRALSWIFSLIDLAPLAAIALNSGNPVSGRCSSTRRNMDKPKSCLIISSACRTAERDA